MDYDYFSELPSTQQTEDFSATASTLFDDSYVNSADQDQTESSSTSESFLPSLDISMSDSEEVREPAEQPETNDKTEQQMASEISSAILSGDAKQVSALMRAAHSKFAGDDTKIGAMGAELGKLLTDKGFDVKVGSGTINIHQRGADNAVSFEVGRYTRAGLSPYRELSYDWATKADVNVKPDSIMSNFGTKMSEPDKGLKDPTEMAKLVERAKQTGDFTEAHRELARTAAHAFQLGGADAVKRFESDMGKKTSAENSAVLVQDGDKLTIHFGKVLSQEETVKALEAGGLKERGIVKTSRGYISTVAEGRVIELKRK